MKLEELIKKTRLDIDRAQRRMDAIDKEFQSKSFPDDRKRIQTLCDEYDTFKLLLDLSKEQLEELKTLQAEHAKKIHIDRKSFSETRPERCAKECKCCQRFDEWIEELLQPKETTK